MIIKSDYRIASVTDGYGVLLRNKHLNDAEHRLPGNSVLFIHGATYGSSATFDYAVDGESWMDAMAMQGFDVWCLDLLGYGDSDRPEQMAQPASDNAPLVDTDHAVAEVDVAVEFICKDRSVDQVSLIGYSWGSAICGRYAGLHPGKVKQLVLSGALWVEPGATSGATKAALGAYRTVGIEQMTKRWMTSFSEEEFEAIVSNRLVRQWCEDTIASDPQGETTGLLRAPTGVFKDYNQCAQTGEPWYRPSLIQAPTQIVVGEFDRETTPGQGQMVFDQLASSPDKRMTIIGGGTHTLLLEKNRHALRDVVSSFLR
jgi:pimeloyl-ACP methyl ester carboxylesterase